MTGVGLVAHSGGMGWDEAVIFAIPVIILGVLQLLARRKAAAQVDEDEGVDERDGGMP